MPRDLHDLVLSGNPPHPADLKVFIGALKAEGLTDRDIDLLTQKNPARLLELEP